MEDGNFQMIRFYQDVLDNLVTNGAGKATVEFIRRKQEKYLLNEIGETMTLPYDMDTNDYDTEVLS